MFFFKKKLGRIKLKIYSNKASPGPPVGPALGQKNLNIINFCKEFNKKTLDLDLKWLIPTLVVYYSDKSYDFFIKKPTVFFYLNNIILKNKKYSAINFFDILEIAKFKYLDFNTDNIYSIIKTILGALKTKNNDSTQC